MLTPPDAMLYTSTPMKQGLPNPAGGKVMADVIYVGVTVGFFLLTWALIRLCEKL
jgi:hypothetical protein